MFVGNQDHYGRTKYEIKKFRNPETLVVRRHSRYRQFNLGRRGVRRQVFITGHDPDFHAQASAGAANLLQTGLDFATEGTTNSATEKFLFVTARPADIGGVPGGHLDPVVAGLNVLGLVEGTHFDVANAAALPGVIFSDYTAIAIASSFGGLLTRAELDALIARSDDIQAFVNAGGGLFASAECDSSLPQPCGADLLDPAPAPLFGFLPITVAAITPVAPYTVTAYGNGTFGLVDADVNDPSHNAFDPVAGLNVVDVDSAGNPMTLAGDVFINDDGFAVLNKEITSGEDFDGVGGIDLAVQKKPTAAGYEYDFTITYDNPDGPPVLIVDTLPAEWIATHIEGEEIPSTNIDDCGEATDANGIWGMVALSKGGKIGKKCQSSTTIEWMPLDGGEGAGALYAADGAGGNPSNLYVLDPTDGSVIQNIGPIGFAVTGLAFDPTDGTLYGSTSRKSVNDPLSLIRIDHLTGEATLIGPHNANPPDNNQACADLAFGVDGTLYCWLEGVLDDLATVDIATGQATPVGDSGLNTLGGGLTFDAGGTLWSCGNCDASSGSQLHSIAPGTGFVSGTAPIVGTTDGRMGAMASDMAGTVFGSRGSSGDGGRPAIPFELVEVDTAGNTISIIGLTVDKIDAIAFRPASGGQSTLKVDAVTRQSPSGKQKFSPTSCGPLLLNDGAIAFEKDDAGNLVLDPITFEPIVVAGPTPPLCLAVVDDLDGVPGIIGNGMGDEDGDGLEDYEEACIIGTDPCSADTDGDGVDDGSDICPGFDDNIDVDADGVPAGCDPDDGDPTVP